MLMVGVFVSKCPTSQLADVRSEWTNKMFVPIWTDRCQGSQANTDTNTPTIFLPQPLLFQM